MIKVLVLSHMYPYPQEPTFGHFVHYQVRELAKLGEVAVISPTPLSPPVMRRFREKWRRYASKPAKAEFEGIPVHYPRYVHLPGERGFPLAPFLCLLALRPQIAELRRRFAFDLIHAHAILPDGLAAAWLGRDAGVPVVCTAHGGDVQVRPYRNRLTRIVTQWGIRNVDMLVAVSAALKESILALESPRQEIRVIPNGVDLDTFHPVNRVLARTELGLPQQSSILVYASRLDEAKGLSYLLSAFSTVKQHNGDCLLALLGEGPYREQLIRQAAELGIEASVLLPGLRPHAEVAKWMNASDLVVLPSLGEGSPLPVYEALACGRPMVASCVGGIPELITSDDYGLLVPPGDSDALAQALLYGLRKEWNSDQIWQHAQQYAWTHVASALLDLYKGLVGSTGEPVPPDEECDTPALGRVALSMGRETRP